MKSQKGYSSTLHVICTLVLGASVFAVLFALFLAFTPVRAGTVCGNGSAPDYGFSYDLMQPHWTVGWEGYASEQAVAQVDTYLDELDYDYIAQTMILILPQEAVGNRVNCAVHFLRYMKLGQPDGDRKDNGFVFLIVVEPDDIDVHYGVGLGLPALTAHELTELNRLAEETYSSTGSMDKTLVALVKDFDRVARENYSPLIVPSPTPQEITLPTDGTGWAILCCLACLVMIIIILVLTFIIRMGSAGIFNSRGGSESSWNNRGPFGGGGGWSSPSGGGGWSRPSGGGFKIPRSRGGSGSGRSGRGN